MKTTARPKKIAPRSPAARPSSVKAAARPAVKRAAPAPARKPVVKHTAARKPVAAVASPRPAASRPAPARVVAGKRAPRPVAAAVAPVRHVVKPPASRPVAAAAPVRHLAKAPAPRPANGSATALRAATGRPIERSALARQPARYPGASRTSALKPVKPAPAAEKTGCTHHWVIEPPNGAVSAGKCRMCGEQREFRNSYEYSSWYGTKTPPKPVAGAAGAPAR